MSLQELLSAPIQNAVEQLFQISIERVEFQSTKKDFEGDITMVVFPLVKQIKGNPVEIGTKIGEYLVGNVAEVSRFNVVAGFLNLVISDKYYLEYFNSIKNNDKFGFVAPKEGEKAVMVEYSSPNTNKPLHLGHVRNNLLGYSVAEIIKASGKKVYKTQIINDRGIHICKSMLAWQKFAPLDENGKRETPFTTDNHKLKKGDHFVGVYYVIFEGKLREESRDLIEDYRNNIFTNYPINKEEEIKIINSKIEQLEQQKVLEIEKIDFNSVSDLGQEFEIRLESAIDNNLLLSNISKFILTHSNEDIKEEVESKGKKFDLLIKPIISLETKIAEELSKIIDYARNNTELMKEAQQMLLDWENGKPEVIELWKTMNQWVYDGFAATYNSLGVDFDSYYYESNTYLLGKDVVEEGLNSGVFFRKEDGSVWIDLTADGLDEKIVLRSDGTSVYMTQDIGTAIQRVRDFSDIGGMVYTVGNEQDYHFKVLFLILKKLGYDWAQHLYHLSYGMVELPSGKMKSREGTVVDADDLMAEMKATAQQISEDLGKLDGFSEEEKGSLYNTIGMGALKYYMLKVDPKKQMMFNPEESVDFNGNTGPFIQYTYARIQSILRKATFDYSKESQLEELHEKEKELIKQVQLFPEVIQSAAENHSPALVANYTYDLVKEFNSFYQNVSILGEDNLDKKVFRVQLSNSVSNVIKNAFGLLGISVPERM